MTLNETEIKTALVATINEIAEEAGKDGVELDLNVSIETYASWLVVIRASRERRRNRLARTT